MAGKLEQVGNFVARGADKVDPRLVDILNRAAEATGMEVQAYSGFRPGDKRQHGKGHATDVRIIGPDGKELPNYQTPESFSAYETLAQAARAIQQKDYPDLDKAFRWGGYFSGDKGKYGAMDLMHFDLGGSDGLGMAGGSWDKGLTKEQASIWGLNPGIQGAGSSALAFAPAAKGNAASDALNSMADGTLKANPVRTVDYVPPPGSGASPQFTPLIAIPSLQLRDSNEHQDSAPAPSVAQPDAAAAPSDDLMRAWGISNESDTGTSDAPVEQASPEDALIKAWGLDQNDAAPAAGLTGAPQGQAPAKGDTAEEPQAKGVADITLGDIGEGANNVVRSLGTGVPVIGGLLNKMNAGTNALVAPIINPMLSEENQLKGDTIGERYANSLAQQEGMDSRYATEHPIANTVGNVVGGVAGMVPAIAAAPAALGASGTASLGTNMLLGGVSGAGIGAADAGIRSGGDIAETGKGAGLGLLFGGLSPAAGKVIGAGANKLMSMASRMTPSGAAGNSLREALAQSGRTIDDVAMEQARNPRLAPADIDPNLQIMAMDLASKPGAPRSVLKGAADARSATAKGAVTDAYDTAAGSVPDVKAYLDNLKATTQQNASKAFGDALNGAKPVDVTPVLKAIDDVVAPGINGVVGKASDIPQGPVEQALSRVRAKLANGNEMLTDADRLHTIQSQLRTEADTLAKSASGQDKLVANALRDVRQNIITQIDDATGGKFRPAQQQYADDNAIQDAFDKGLEVFKGGTGRNSIENRPEYWDAWVKQATPAELEAAKVGTRVAVDQAISGVRNAAAKGEAIADVDFNVARLESLLGKSETQKLVQTLKDERRIAQTNANLFAGSNTAPRQAVNKLTQVPEITPGISLSTPMAIGGGYTVGGLPGAAAGAALSVGRMGAQAAQRAAAMARNRLIAEAIVGDATKFRDAASVGASIPQMARAAQMGTNRLLTAVGPSAANQLTDYIAPRVPVNVPQVAKRPLEITVRPNAPR